MSLVDNGSTHKPRGREEPPRVRAPCRGDVTVLFASNCRGDSDVDDDVDADVHDA